VVEGDETLDFTLASHRDSFGHVCRQSDFGFIDASHPLSLTGDDEVVAVDLPFPFTFYGTTYRGAFAATDGFLNFLDPQKPFSNDSIPDTDEPNAAVYPLLGRPVRRRSGHRRHRAGRDRAQSRVRDRVARRAAGRRVGADHLRGGASRERPRRVPVRRPGHRHARRGRLGDTLGDTWQADRADATGSFGYLDNGRSKVVKTSHAIDGTDDDAIYQTARQNAFEYRFDGLPAGIYEVDMRLRSRSSRARTSGCST
jgi:hypothetical protein